MDRVLERPLRPDFRGRQVQHLLLLASWASPHNYAKDLAKYEQKTCSTCYSYSYMPDPSLDTTKPQFTKRTFVRHKNTQTLRIFFLIQSFTPVTNIQSILKLIQRFRCSIEFSIFFKTFYLLLTDILLFTFKLSQTLSRITKPLLGWKQKRRT